MPPGSALCPTCAYDPFTGDTALNPPRPEQRSSGGTWVTVVSGLFVLVAILLVIGAVTYLVRDQVVNRPSETRTFGTESGVVPGSR